METTRDVGATSNFFFHCHQTDNNGSNKKKQANINLNMAVDVVLGSFQLRGGQALFTSHQHPSSINS